MMRLSAVLVGLTIASANAAVAQKFPERPIRLIIPQATGGTSDILARSMTGRLSDYIGQTVVVDNRAGASAIIGTEMAAKSPPDGHTIIIVYTTHTTAPLLYSKVPYKPLDDFAPISMLMSSPLIMVVAPTFPTKTVKEFLAYAKERPGKLNFGSAAPGSAGHLAHMMLNVLAGLDTVHIPYKGTAPALTDLIGGQLQFMFAALLPVQPLIRAGRLRPLAVTSAKRSGVMPDLPTVAESGVPGFETAGWWGALAPAGTPKPIVERWYGVFGKALQAPEVKDRLSGEGAEVVGSTPAEFTAYLKADSTRWAPIIKKSGAKLD